MVVEVDMAAEQEEAVLVAASQGPRASAPLALVARRGAAPGARAAVLLPASETLGEALPAELPPRWRAIADALRDPGLPWAV